LHTRRPTTAWSARSTAALSATRSTPRMTEEEWIRERATVVDVTPTPIEDKAD
jgi:hypothetical protein